MIPDWVVIVLAVWLGLSSLTVTWLALRAWRLGRLTRPVESKEAPGGLQGPRPLP